MNPSAVEQAKQRLAKAEKALSALNEARNFHEAEDAWIDFLIAASSIYSKLEQGVKADLKSAQWFGRKKNERKNDPLLSYLHQARNSSEHGIERTVGQTPPNRDGIGRPLKFNERVGPFAFKAHDPGTGELKAEFEAVFAGPTLKAVKVTDQRSGKEFNPPRTHLGQDIPYCDFADGLGKQAIIYLRLLILEAESFCDARHP